MARMRAEKLKPVLSSVVPIFRGDAVLEQIGSGVLLQFGEAKIIISAAHVFDDIPDHDALIPLVDGIGPLDGTLFIKKVESKEERSNDRMDFAFLVMTDDSASRVHNDFSFLQEAYYKKSDNLAVGLSMVGYLEKHAELVRHKASATRSIFDADLAPSATFSAIRRSRGTHIVGQFRRKKAKSYPDGSIRIQPRPFGMSGGGMFEWSFTKNSPHQHEGPRLCGILTEYHESENAFVGTAIEVILNTIRLEIGL
ncbi:MAG TPA: hypothetical protein PLN52_25825, partial [Opitutaceae bacterium]|nr:hypothetical protein [Opitutaceae bacterium]